MSDLGRRCGGQTYAGTWNFTGDCWTSPLLTRQCIHWKILEERIEEKTIYMTNTMYIISYKYSLENSLTATGICSCIQIWDVDRFSPKKYTMKSIMGNQIARRVMDEVNDLKKKNKTPKESTMAISSAPTYGGNQSPAYYHQPPSYQQQPDSYSHTGRSTAGYSQNPTYPTLRQPLEEREKQICQQHPWSLIIREVGKIVIDELRDYREKRREQQQFVVSVNQRSKGKTNDSIRTSSIPATSSVEITNNKTFLGKIESSISNVAGAIVGQDTAVLASNKLNSLVTKGKSARELIKAGAVIQLMSKNSGQLLQLVTSANGLTFDGCHPSGSNAFNTYFTVEESDKGRFRFHNNLNYLAFRHNQACIINLPPGTRNNTEVDFRIHDIIGSSDLVALESCSCKNYFISIAGDGHLKTKNMKDKNIDAQFLIIPVTNNIPSSYPPMSQPSYNSYQNPQSNPYQNPQSNPYQNPQSNPYQQIPPNPYYDSYQQPPPPLYGSPYGTSSPYNNNYPPPPPAQTSSIYPQFQ
ncbi:unnamed protein product [Didymodactylos carnosus]|uniref:Uncharacterized protein n=1 Tax=Didymodactylos carnosus TaxID=1234261 RepID=A0A813W4U5_9BILA|nr:unnamed protein product [Didymodactylos carnosus]CAF1301778.1 unnamed protein product [Didymodactylos carnosus]CAF3643401.1 unnamed protein product [Didymodactylos carnosus]CAF4108135.1 unnamed protein product [Didymodactylos carnosus]